ncbi:nuclear transport factor 2 family protein [Streptomyces sp. NPDC001595]|uniref:nuclear transport factor 2 family protein n=1 Tax=Streptomyces sp. NPDC001532 TaxID=3154520 RepID=UPI00332C7523
MNDVDAVAQLVLHERQARDRLWWDAMRDCFAPDARIRLSWFQGSGGEFVERSERMAHNGDRATHRLGPPVVDVHGNRAIVELPAVIEVTTTVAGVEAVLSSFARLLYRVVKRDERWKILRLDPVYERDALSPSLPGAELRVPPDAVKDHRRPYRFLTYVLEQRGYGIRQDLFGDDRPEEVAELYEDAYGWLRAGNVRVAEGETS